VTGSELTAQDVFARMLREHVAPALRTAGLLGSGQTFELRDAGTWAVLGFCKSRYSHAGEVEFTVMVAAVGKDRWEQIRADVTRPRLGRRPAPSDTVYAQALRLDQLPGGPGDAWFTVHPDTDPAVLAAGLLEHVRAAALPWLAERAGRHPHRDTAAGQSATVGDLRV